MGLLCTKLRLPSHPPEPADISPAILALHNTITTRYVGAASLIPMKDPQEGYRMQGKQLEAIRTGYVGNIDRVFRLSPDQQAVFQAGLQNFNNFGGHGSGTISRVFSVSPGKTVLMKAGIVQDACTIAANPDLGDHTMNICVWQEGADALLEEYRQLAATLPRAEHLDVRVMTKSQLMRTYQVNENSGTTTLQINAICRNISLTQSSTFFLYIDECWITVFNTFTPHITEVRFEK